MPLVACLLPLVLRDVSDVGIIAAVLLINTGLSFFQEFRSGKVIINLQKLVNKQIIVLRDNSEVLIDERLIVPGRHYS